jgi:putative hydrolase of the HAD superfamily
MKQIKHFSFDLWFTLIKSNPAFKKERALYFYHHFNTLSKSIDEVETAFRQTDLMCNAVNEKTGKNIDAEEMYLMVIYMLNNSLEPFKKLDTAALYKEMEALILKYMPTIFNEQTYTCLDRIKQNGTATLNILSNTAFIRGETLRKINEELALSKYFDFQLYSDEAGVSKPNADMYRLLLQHINTLRANETIALDEIMHIGDNPVADIYGATSFGINAFQINSNGKLITNLFN